MSGSHKIDIPVGAYAVIFIADLVNEEGYADMADRMVELAKSMPGFLGIESQRGATGRGITVSYWKDEASIKHWKQNQEHLEAQRQGRSSFYSGFKLQVARIERAYSFERES